MRQVVLDTETTGRDIAGGHRIIEIGCVELINRRITGNRYQQYINPQRESEAGALAVHGLTQDFLRNKPLFKEIADEFLSFIKGAELIIHNAAFDLAFLNNEFLLTRKKYDQVANICRILDTLPLARQMHPGQRNSLDALCKRYAVDNSHRNLHGALLDANLLALVYLAMTSGQTTLFNEEKNNFVTATQAISSSAINHADLTVIFADETELVTHANYLEHLDKASHDGCLWLKKDTT